MNQYVYKKRPVVIEADHLQDLVKDLSKWIKRNDVWVWDIVFEMDPLRVTVYYEL